MKCVNRSYSAYIDITYFGYCKIGMIFSIEKEAGFHFIDAYKFMKVIRTKRCTTVETLVSELGSMKTG